MNRTVVEIIAIMGGILLIIFRNRFIEGSTLFQHQTFGFKYGRKEKELYRWLVLLFGLVLIGFGIWSIASN